MMHAHYGNGADDTIDRLNDAGIRHHTMGKHFQEKADVGRNDTTFLAWLDRAIDDCRDVELGICQAGAAPHIKDALGGMLATAAMRKRDLAVFKAFRGRPLAWNLAGGYQRDANGGIAPALMLHRNILEVQRDYQP